MIISAFDDGFVQALTLIVSVLLPVLVGLVTKWSTKSSIKAVLLLLLSAVTGFGGELIDASAESAPYDIKAGVYAAVSAFVIACAIHYGVWKPTGVTEAAQNSLVRDGKKTYQS